MKRIFFLELFILFTLCLNANFFPTNRKGDWQDVGVLTTDLAVTKTINILSYPTANNTGLITADNNSAVQTAVNDRDVEGFTIIYFPSGTYFFDSPINIQYSNIVLMGDDDSNTKLNFSFNNSSGNCINITGIAGNGPGIDGGPFDDNAVPICNVGIEKLSIEKLTEDSTMGYTGNSIYFFFADNCWVRSIESYNSSRHHILAMYSENLSVTGSYIHHAYNYGTGGNGYGVQLIYYTRKCLVENNIFSNLRHSMVVNDVATNNIFSYNYSRVSHCTPEYLNIDDYTADCCVHGANEDDPDIWGNLPTGPQKNLFEGNDCVQMITDNAHNPNGTLNTFFRNKVRKYGIHVASQDPTQNVVANWIIEGCSSTVLEGMFNTLTGYPSGILGVSNDHFDWVNQIGDSGPGIDYCYDHSLYCSNKPSFFTETLLWPPFGASDYSELGHGLIPARQRYESGSKTTFYGLPNYQYVYELSGNVSLQSTGNIIDINIKITNEDNGNEIIIHPDDNGDFSRVLNVGDYSVEYNYNSTEIDYYPVKYETCIAYSSVSLPNVSLFPISVGIVYVSTDPTHPQSFSSLCSGIYYLQQNGGGILMILPGTYSGAENKNLRWSPYDSQLNPLHIKIQGVNKETCIVNCSGSTGFTFEDEIGGSLGLNYTADDCISNLTLINGAPAIKVIDGSPLITNNIIKDCISSPMVDDFGGGIQVESACTISNNVFDNCQIISTPATGYGGGLSVRNADDCVIINNEFMNCVANQAGAVYMENSDNIVFSGNSVHGNSVSSLYPEDVLGCLFTDCNSMNFSGNLIYENGVNLTNRRALLFTISDGIEFVNNTVMNHPNHSGVVSASVTNFNINNSVLYGNNQDLYVLANPSPVVSYSKIGNAPQLDANYKPLWNASTKSVCIDAGDPSILDADGTPSDIGAVCAVDHKIDSMPLIQMSSGINWKCFPVIDDIYNDLDIAENFFNDIMQQINPSLYMVVPEDYQERIYWNLNEWRNDDQVIESVKGYKVYMNTPYTMEISGFLEDPSTVISLHSGENWIGYFLEDSMKPLDALASVLDDIDEIQTKTFTMEKTALGWLSSDKWTLNYGDLVIVNCTTPCNFYWGENGGGASETSIRPQAQSFSYTEEADYVPVYVELDSQSRSNPVEIGLFVDGVCKGAEVINESTVQIRAYVTGDSTAFDPGEVTFQLSYGNRMENETISSYRMKDTINHHGTLRSLDFNEDSRSYYIVSFEGDEGSAPQVNQTVLGQNYPNPFNPATTISYSLIADGNVELCVFNTKGQKVKTLVNGSTVAGEHSVQWNGTDDSNAKVSSGLYFYRLKTAEKTINRKMVLLK